MQDDDQGEEDRRAERHIERVKREAGEAAHVEGVEYEANVVEAEPPLSNTEAADQGFNRRRSALGGAGFGYRD